jgi:transposase
VAWRDVPERHGPWAMLHTRFRRWSLDGTFVLQAARARADAAGTIDWLVSVDSTVARAPISLRFEVMKLATRPLSMNQRMRTP